MKTIKEKPISAKPKTTGSTPVLKAVIKEVLIRSKEKSMEIAEQMGAAGQEPGAQNRPATEAGDQVTGALDRGVDYSARQVYRAGRTVREQATQHRQSIQNPTPSAPETPSSAPSTNPKGKPTQAGAKPGLKEKRTRAKPAKERTPQQAIKQTKKQFRTLPHTVKSPASVPKAISQAVPAVTPQQKAIRAAGKLREMADAVARAIRASIQAIRSMFAAISAAGAIAATIIIIICLVAFIAGSAYGIFFAAEAPGEDAITVRAAVEQLSEEYRDAILEIETSVPHDREEVESNDGVYSIQWQDVLAVYSSRISGDQYGSSVAALDEEQVENLRQTMWEMNELDHTTRTETITLPPEEESDEDESEEEEPQTITLTVLVIQLTHKSAEDMADHYNFNSRQQEYLELLQAPETESLWDDLLGGFAAGGEILTPAGGWTPNSSLQWPLPVSGSITSPYGYRTDPISGQTSYHSGTDIAAPNGTPILAAADGTVAIANGTDSWGGSYGYYVKLEHGGIQTLYAHCSAICVTSGQQVQAGQVIAYVGSTGRSTGNHLHFEVYAGGGRTDPLSFFG